MERPLDKGTKVKILAGRYKDKIGSYQYHCCSGYVIDLDNGDRTYLHDRSDFSIATAGGPKAVKAKAPKSIKQQARS